MKRKENSITSKKSREIWTSTASTMGILTFFQDHSPPYFRRSSDQPSSNNETPLPYCYYYHHPRWRWYRAIRWIELNVRIGNMN